MPILNADKIRELIKSGRLIRGALVDSTGNPVVEPASYDLRAGIALWKDPTSGRIEAEYFDPEETIQPLVTLKPGQMVFVITHEDINLPDNISGTVYSRNRLQKQNVLALNAGHIDPLYEGPILIRLINLGSTEWVVGLGEAVFTVVFHTVEPAKNPKKPDRRTREETLREATKTAADAFSNPFHDLYKDEIQRQLADYYSTVESNIRSSLEDKFFSKKQVSLYMFYFGAAIVGGIFLLSRIPWNTVSGWAKHLLALE